MRPGHLVRGVAADLWWLRRLRYPLRQFPLEIEALPVDLYRVLMGCLVTLYYVRLLCEFPEFTAYDGYLDHELSLRIFFFAGGVNLFQPWLPAAVHLLWLLLGLVGILCVVVGYRVKLGALVALLVAVCDFRWNFPVANLDDTSMQLGMLWILLLPTGRTLILSEALKDPAGVWARWSAERVPSVTVWAFQANLTVIYLVTGLSKLTSSLWLDGLALFIVLRLPLASTSSWWGMDVLPATMIFNFLTLIIEPILPLVFFLRPYHLLKFGALLAFLGLHLGILLTIGIPYANFGLLCALALVFRVEINDWVTRLAGRREAPRPAPPARLGVAVYSWFVVLIVALSMTEGVPGMGPAYVPGFALQWTLGMAQEYHLFDWVDKFNYVVRQTVTVDGKPVDPGLLFPPKVRGFLVQSYLYNMRWMRVPKGQMGELQRSLKERSARQFALRYPGSGVVKVVSNVQRATADNLELNQGEDRLLMQFEVKDGKVVRMLEPW